jgi:NADH-quinone oxidoreductase subunit K
MMPPELARFGPDHLAPYLAVAAVLFAAGVLAAATRRNAIGTLIGLELMLNAAALQFAAYGRFRSPGGEVEATAASLFVIVLAAAEAAVALALLFAAYRTAKDVDLEQARELRQ